MIFMSTKNDLLNPLSIVKMIETIVTIALLWLVDNDIITLLIGVEWCNLLSDWIIIKKIRPAVATLFFWNIIWVSFVLKFIQNVSKHNVNTRHIYARKKNGEEPILPSLLHCTLSSFWYLTDEGEGTRGLFLCSNHPYKLNTNVQLYYLSLIKISINSRLVS